MSGDSKFFIGVVVAAVLIIGGIVLFTGDSKPTPTTADQLDESIGHKLGPDSASVKIVEFGDFQCPACAAAAKDFELAQSNNPEKVQIIFRHFPLPMHRNGLNGSLAAEAASRQNKFWPMYELLYANQKQWQDLDNPLDTYVNYAKDLNLDADQFKKDYADKDLKKAVEADRDYGLSLGIDRTPTFYANKTKYTGAISLADWQKTIDAILAASAAASPEPAT